MDTTEKNPKPSKAPKTQSIPKLEREQGFYNSTTIAKSPTVIFDFFKDKKNVEKVLTDLPKEAVNFLELDLISSAPTGAEQFEIKWKNKPSAKVQGTLSMYFKQAPADHGTILSAVAVFDEIDWKDEEPSTLMNIFLRRFKALAETGEIATTKGQPSGREEIETSDKKTKH